jgi:hypothetical protein
MRIEQIGHPSEASLRGASLVFAFTNNQTLSTPGFVHSLRKAYPGAILAGCSTAGEIRAEHVQDDSLVITAIELERSHVQGDSIQLSDFPSSYHAGIHMGSCLPRAGLKHAIVISDGLRVNGSELARGLEEALPEGVVTTGGLAGDADRFKETSILFQDSVKQGSAFILGLYGSVRVGYGSLGGWDPFGPERRITRAFSNKLHDLDGESALGLYKKYLGDFARDLPASALLFPLRIRAEQKDPGVVRTVLAVQDEEDSMTFAGQMPTGWYATLMRANFDRLIDGAVTAAQSASLSLRDPDFALLISCVGRKLVLKQRIEEEVEGVREVLGPRTSLCGFYSYGELSPFTPGARCELHNQTMTITTLSE